MENKRSSVLDFFIDESKDSEYLFTDCDFEMSSIIRDITNLLNTRRYAFFIPAYYSDIKKSIVSLGLGMYSSYEANSLIKRRKLMGQICQLLEDFEPRIKNVVVKEHKESRDALTPSFHISAKLNIVKQYSFLELNLAFNLVAQQIVVSEVNYG